MTTRWNSALLLGLASRTCTFALCLVGFLALFAQFAAAEVACPAPPAVQAAFEGIRPRYLASRGPAEIVDKAAVEQNNATLKHLREFSGLTTRLSDQVVAGDPSAATCLNGILDAWAAENALLGPATSSQGRLERAWALAGLSLTAFKLERSGYPPSKATKDWLHRLAMLVQDEQRFSRSPDANNRTLWAVLGTGIIALMTDDQDLWIWSLGRVDNFLDHVQPDGVAPTELARRARATRYHFFAAQPLMAFDRVARCYGRPFDADQKEAMERFLVLLRALQAREASLETRAQTKQRRYYRHIWFDLLDKPKVEPGDQDVHMDRLGGSVSAFSRVSDCRAAEPPKPRSGPGGTTSQP